MVLEGCVGEARSPGGLSLRRDMVKLLVELRGRWGGRVAELLALGLPDWRAPALGAAIADVVDRTRNELSAEDRTTLAHFVRGLPGRFDDVAACVLRASLVHGHFHPRNSRGHGRALTLLVLRDSV